VSFVELVGEYNGVELSDSLSVLAHIDMPAATAFEIDERFRSIGQPLPLWPLHNAVHAQLPEVVRENQYVIGCE